MRAVSGWRANSARIRSRWTAYWSKRQPRTEPRCRPRASAAPIGPRGRGAHRLQHAAERVSLERVAELKMDVGHGIGFVAAGLLEPGRVDAVLHAGAQRAAPEAVAAERRRVEAGLGGPRLHDPGNCAGIDGGKADAGQGGVAAVPAAGGIRIRRNIAPS